MSAETVAKIRAWLDEQSLNGQSPHTRLSDDFWDARDHLDHIRRAAHSRQRSADALLHVVLARTSAAAAHTLEIPAIVGTVAPLSYFALVLAPPGVGKSSVNAIGAELVPPPGWLVDQMPLGSGEGLAELLFELVDETAPGGKTKQVKRQTNHNVYLYLDEGDAITALGGRQGSTLLSTLRTVWTGGPVGQSNANRERRRIVPARSYTYGLVIGCQPHNAGALLDDANSGTPQRFGWASAVDPTIPDDPPGWPGPLDWTPPARTVKDHEPLKVDDSITDEVRRADLDRSRGAATPDPLDAHAQLYRLKVAGNLALLAGRQNISAEDWELAGEIQRVSDATRAGVVAAVEAEAELRETAASERHARREVTADVAKHTRQVVDCARKIRDKVAEKPGEWTAGRLRAGLSRRQRDVFTDGLAHAFAEGWVAEDTEPGQGDDDKQRLYPG